MEKPSRFILILICLTLSSLFIFSCNAFLGSGKKKVLHTAVFTAPGATTDNCIQATISILTANGIKVKTITAAEINASEGLKGLDVILFPGGSGSGEAKALGRDGCAVVAQFVKNGGGFIGTCAGAYLGALGYAVKGVDTSASSWLDLVNAEVIDADHWARGTGDPQVKVTDPMHPILKGFPATFNAHYVNGPLFKPGSNPSLPAYQELAIFTDDICTSSGTSPGIMPGTAALITSEYDKGRCVLFSFHPELTPGLEKMLVQAVLWSARKVN